MFDRLSHYYFNKGLENAKAGMISAAVENLRKSLSYNISNTEAWKLIGLCFYRLGSLSTAEYCWTSCLRYGEADASVEEYIKNTRAVAVKVKPYMEELFQLSSKKKYKKASSVFRKNIIPVLNSQADVFNYLGILYMLSGRKRKALKEWKKALLIDCSGVSAVRYLANTGHIAK